MSAFSSLALLPSSSLVEEEGTSHEGRLEQMPFLGNGCHIETQAGTIPTAAAGAGGGSAPPAPVVLAGSTDSRGSVTWGTGTTAVAGVQVAVTFACPYAVIPTVVLTPNTSLAAAKVPYVTAVTAAGFSIGFQTAGADSQANTVYGANWLCLQ